MLCGIARIAAARQLRDYGVSRFGDAGCLSALNHYINNPSVIGFFLEQVVLSSITSWGLDISREIFGPMKAIMFPGKVTRFESSPALYWPLQFNYPAVDGIIVRFDNSNKRKKCFIYPLQITVAKSHSDSEESFFRTWDHWTNDLKDRYDLEVEFFWITADETPSSADFNEKSFSLRSGKKLRPSYKRVHIPLKTVNEDIWWRYRLPLLSKEGGWAFNLFWTTWTKQHPVPIFQQNCAPELIGIRTTVVEAWNDADVMTVRLMRHLVWSVATVVNGFDQTSEPHLITRPQASPAENSTPPLADFFLIARVDGSGI
jgi:hypothetical protein